jgi:hypothetical protein
MSTGGIKFVSVQEWASKCRFLVGDKMNIFHIGAKLNTARSFRKA